MKNYFGILSIKENASPMDIGKAFDRIIQADLRGEVSDIHYKDAVEAYGVLSDKDRRAEYMPKYRLAKAIRNPSMGLSNDFLDGLMGIVSLKESFVIWNSELKNNQAIN